MSHALTRTISFSGIADVVSSFNEEVAVDLVWLDGRPAFHAVDVGTHYQNAVFLRGESVQHVWDALVECWASVYVGFPNKLRTDQGSVFTSKAWSELTRLHGIELQLSGIASHNSIGVGERYHAPLRRVYSIVRAATPGMSDELSLRCAIKGMNDTLGPEGLVPTYLVYGTFPSFPVRKATNPTHEQRMKALAAARAEMATITSELRVLTALKSKLPPATQYDIQAGDNVLVYQEGTGGYGRRAGQYVGPFRVEKICGKEVYVRRNNRTAHYNITHVLPDPVERGDRELQTMLKAMQQFRTPQPNGVFITEIVDTRDPRAKDARFDEAKQKELRGLFERGVFDVVCREELPQSANVLGGRFVLGIKNPGTEKEIYKARFVVQGHTDAEKGLLIHNSTTLKQSSIRLLIAIAAMFGFRIWAQDVAQAYLQSAEALQREVFIRPTGELRLGRDQLLRLLKPLYGLTDSGDYWHQTFSRHLKEYLTMRPTAGDLSLYIRRIHDELEGLVGAYVDDSIGTGTTDFENESRITEKKFQSKPREMDRFTFAGIEIEPLDDGYLLHQRTFASRIKMLSKDCSF